MRHHNPAQQCICLSIVIYRKIYNTLGNNCGDERKMRTLLNWVSSPGHFGGTVGFSFMKNELTVIIRGKVAVTTKISKSNDF